MNVTKIVTILEGTDAVGKDTFIEKQVELEKQMYGGTIRVFHEDQDTDYTHDKVLARMQDHNILNRSVIGEHVWSRVFNREPRISMADTKKIFNLLEKQGFTIMIILKYNTPERIHEIIKQRGEDPLSYDPDEVFKMFVDVLNELELDFMVYNKWEE